MDKQKIPDIIFNYPTSYPQEEIEKEISGIKDEKLDLKVNKENPRAYMALEWIVPTIFGVYILKPYFNAFLSEMGKDHYQLLKKGLKKIVKKIKQLKARMIASSDSPDKLSKKYTKSVVISIVAQCNNNQQIKLLFNNELELVYWESAIDEFLDYLLENYNSYPKDRLSTIIKEKSQKVSEVIYVIINPETKRIEFCNNPEMFDKFKS